MESERVCEMPETMCFLREREAEARGEGRMREQIEALRRELKAVIDAKPLFKGDYTDGYKDGMRNALHCVETRWPAGLEREREA